MLMSAQLSAVPCRCNQSEQFHAECRCSESKMQWKFEAVPCAAVKADTQIQVHVRECSVGRFHRLFGVVWVTVGEVRRMWSDHILSCADWVCLSCMLNFQLAWRPVGLPGVGLEQCPPVATLAKTAFVVKSNQCTLKMPHERKRLSINEKNQWCCLLPSVRSEPWQQKQTWPKCFQKAVCLNAAAQLMWFFILFLLAGWKREKFHQKYTTSRRRI